MKINWFHRLCALVCVLLISGIDATAALNAYLKIDGISGDAISNKVTYGDHVEVYGYNHELHSPVDLATGQATGKRQHRPLKFLKRMSGNSSQFVNAWVRQQTIRSAELKVFHNNYDTGLMEQIYVYKLTNVRVVSIRDWTSNILDPTTAVMPALQEISLVYQSIEWQSLPDGPVVQDTWAGTPN